jgi:spoIIIJ-associated protein
MRCSVDNMIEIDGKTVDEAIEKACTAFGVPREKLSIDILSEGTSGFMGLGSKKAKILASLLTLDMNDDIKLSAREDKRERPMVRVKDLETPLTPANHIDMPTAPVAEPISASESEKPVGITAKTLLEGLLERMSIPSPVVLEETDEAIILNIEGDGDGLLIGKRGQNLDALQHIVNKAVNKLANGKKMIIVDTETYRKRREESLVTLAERLGQKVKKTRKTVTVSNMNAHDRRIIHMTLQGDAALLTKSRGEGEYRKIIIMPARRERESGHARNNAAADGQIHPQ